MIEGHDAFDGNNSNGDAVMRDDESNTYFPRIARLISDAGWWLA